MPIYVMEVLSNESYHVLITVGSHLSELHLSEHVSYRNVFSKATTTIYDSEH